MSPKELTAFRMAPELMTALRLIRQTDGIPVAAQIDRAVREWLERQGIQVQTPQLKVSAAARRRAHKRAGQSRGSRSKR